MALKGWDEELCPSPTKLPKAYQKGCPWTASSNTALRVIWCFVCTYPKTKFSFCSQPCPAFQFSAMMSDQHKGCRNRAKTSRTVITCVQGSKKYLHKYEVSVQCSQLSVFAIGFGATFCWEGSPAGGAPPSSGPEPFILLFSHADFLLCTFCPLKLNAVPHKDVMLCKWCPTETI